MAYTANTPLANQAINATQPLILDNFTLLNPVGNGYMAFLLQGTAPTFAAGSNGMYTLLNATTTKNELYISKQSNNAPTEVPFAASKMSNETVATCDSGWSYLPSGLLIKWGIVNVTTNAFATVDVATISGGPNFTRAFQVLISKDSNSNSYGDISSFDCGTDGFSSLTTGNFRIYGVNVKGTAPVTRARYVVIGV